MCSTNTDPEWIFRGQEGKQLNEKTKYCKVTKVSKKAHEAGTCQNIPTPLAILTTG